MAEKDKYADELLSEDELDQVAGGNWKEFTELREILPTVSYQKNTRPFPRQVTRNMNITEATEWLKSNLNIDTDISIGDSFNPFSSGTPNIYKRDGQELTHDQVIAEVKSFLGK